MVGLEENLCIICYTLMRSLLLLAIFGCLGACAQQPLTEGDVFTFAGQVHTISQRDLQMALAVARRDMVMRYGSELPITRVEVVDHNHVWMRYWSKGNATYTQLERVTNRWRVIKR